MHYRVPLVFLLTLLSFAVFPALYSNAIAASFEILWSDNSSDETGFQVERKPGTTGTYRIIATTAANVTSYNDLNLTDNTTYCYRVNSFNSAGNSPYTPEACGTTPPTPPPATSTTSITSPTPGTTFTAGQLVNASGSGTNLSWDIDVIGDGLASFATGVGSSVTFAVPAYANTSQFVRITLRGDGGTATRDYNISATSAPPPPQQQFTLTVSVVKTTTSSGTGNGTVTSSSAGINCGGACSASFNSGTLVTLTATPASGSTFAGWSGTGCSTGVVSMTVARSCTATFNPQPSQTTNFVLSLSKNGTGNGTVTSTPSGINCGSTCSVAHASGTVVTLKATATAGSTFNGWSGTGCSGGVVTMNASKNCAASFQSTAIQLTTKIGVFRPQTGEWYLDRNGNGKWDGCNVDKCIGSFGQPGDLPITGSWNGNDQTNLGTFTPGTGSWRLDTNGDGILDCAVDTCEDSFGQAGDFPIVRELGDGNGSIVGIFTPQRLETDRRQWKRIKRGSWNFDANGNSTLDGCEVDECTTFGTVGELPIVGDWNSTGKQEIGVFVPKKGSWHLDTNGNGKWDGCRKDKCLGRFGAKGDLPVIGDWDGTGSVRVGVFQPSTGMWYLDINGNGKLESCTVDACFGPFGQPGDLPVVGKW